MVLYVDDFSDVLSSQPTSFIRGSNICHADALQKALSGQDHSSAGETKRFTGKNDRRKKPATVAAGQVLRRKIYTLPR
jgi:hypothetical protein